MKIKAITICLLKLEYDFTIIGNKTHRTGTQRVSTNLEASKATS